MNNRTIFSRIIIGFKKGWNTPSLPPHLIELNNNPLIRIMRFLGGVSIFMIITHKYGYSIILYINIFLTLIFGLYHFYLTYYRFKHIYKLIKNGDLNVRNSPLDKLASIASNILMCFKGSCDVVSPLATPLALMLGIEAALRDADKQPIFSPIFSMIIDKFPNLSVTSPHADIIQQVKLMKLNYQDIQDLNSLELDITSVKSLTPDDVNFFVDGIKSQKALILEQNETMRSMIAENLKNFGSKPFDTSSKSN